MDELENAQPEEISEVVETEEAVEAPERAEEQAVEDATHEPGARVEETQNFEQAEAVEEALVEAIEVAAVQETQPSEAEDIPPAESDTDPSDLPQGSGVLEEPHESAAMADRPEAPGPASEAEIPEDIEIKPAAEDGTVDRDDPGRVDSADLRETSDDEGEDQDKATPINLPGPVPSEVALDYTGPGGNVVGGAKGGDVAATPINIPKPDGNMTADDVKLEGQIELSPDDVKMEAGTWGTERMSGMPGLDGLAGEMLVTEDGEFVVMGIEGGMDPEGEGEQEVPEEGGEGSSEAPDWYIHEDEDGNISVVDADGNPVESPPKIVYFQGKYYAVYPGDDLPVKADGSVTDPNKLAEYEISSYEPSTEGMQVYYDDDGNPVIVDENGHPVESPPALVQDPVTGKYYFITETDPSKLASFTKSGNFAAALSQGLIKEAPDYMPPSEGLQIHYDKDGNPTVVDENGHPVESPPAVVQDPVTGKYYFITETDPSKLASFTKSGNFAAALSQGLIKEAPDYKPSSEGLQIHYDKDGNPTVVDENGHPVESPPAVVQDPVTGKYYFITETDPSKLASFTKSGNFAAALSQGLIKEATDYKPSSEGLQIHYDKDGNPTVVDENGHPVESPPAVVQDPVTGKYYFITETDPSKLASFTKSGNFAAALSQGLIKEATDYKPSTEGMHIYPDKDGNPTVVDENGVPVESPPAVIQDPTTGKYYFITESDPSKLSSFAKSGNFAAALSQGLIKEAPDYKPPWWKKKL
jgi:hypothetical protein